MSLSPSPIGGSSFAITALMDGPAVLSMLFRYELAFFFVILWQGKEGGTNLSDGCARTQMCKVVKIVAV
jgi:hypothetical protein